MKLQQFVHAKQHWVVQTLNKLASNHLEKDSFAPEHYLQGTELRFQGQSYQLTIKASKLKNIKIELADELYAHIPQHLIVTDYSLALKSAMQRWLKKQAALKVQYYVQLHAVKHQLWPRTMTIKTQKSRWGSCGINNDIHINWLLIMAPPEVLEYVVVHELCHIQERNHSQHFWALVVDHLPGYKQTRQWLKKYGGQLMRAGA